MAPSDPPRRAAAQPAPSGPALAVGGARQLQRGLASAGPYLIELLL